MKHVIGAKVKDKFGVIIAMEREVNNIVDANVPMSYFFEKRSLKIIRNLNSAAH